MFNKEKCPGCKSGVKSSFDYCPYCGCDLRNPEKDRRDFGMLGKNNIEGLPMIGGGGLGITDKMISSLMNQLFKTLDKEMNRMGNPEVENLPNGIKIRFGTESPKKKVVRKKTITQEQIDKMAGLPRVEAKTSVRRLSDKVVYELNAPGIENADDVFVSKLENGYEVKAIGGRKVYVNSLPINLPLKGYQVSEKGLSVEFGLQ